MNTLDTLVEIVAEELNKTPEEVRNATSLAELDVDSLGMIEVIMAAEDKLKVNISDRALVGLTSLEGLAQIIDETLAKQTDGFKPLGEGKSDEESPDAENSEHALG